MNYVNLVISSRFENARLAALCIKEVASQSFNSAALNEIEISMVELVNNCIEHAYKEAADQLVSIELKLFEDRLVIDVTDNGIALDPSVLKHMNGCFEFDPNDLDNLPEGGFGLNLIKVSMDEVKYERLNNKNCWVLTKNC